MLSLEKKQIAELVKFAAQLVQSQRGEPLDRFDQAILAQALQGIPLKDIRVEGLEKSTIKTCRAPALWKLLSGITNQKVGLKNVQRVLKATYDQERPKPIATSLVHQTAIFENLPAPTCARFVGRSAELKQLMELLSPEHSAPRIKISGIGGMGKTSLALECAQRCLVASRKAVHGNIPRFELFLFVSAKLFHLGVDGLIPRHDPARSLSDILQQMADALGLDFTGLELREQTRLLKKMFLQKRTLLIIDNLETVENQNDLLGFLFDLPRSVKVILTTREQREYSPLCLTALTEQDSLNLIEHEVKARSLPLTKAQQHQLYEATKGVPLALNYVIGKLQLQGSSSFETVTRGISQPTHQVAQYCFEATIQPLRGTIAHQILIALALLPAPVSEELLLNVAVPGDNRASTALVDLRCLMLIEETKYRYSMQPMTQEYMLAEAKHFPTVAATIRERWINQYLEFTQAYADRDATSWQIQFEELSQEWPNIQAIAQWLMEANQFETMHKLWRNLEAYTYAMGRERMRSSYWAIRLNWTTWLIQSYKMQASWTIVTQLMLEQAWTLVTARNAKLLPEAEELFQQIWDLKHYQTEQFLMDTALKRAVLYLEKHDAAAEIWLTTSETLMAQVSLDEQAKAAQTMKLRYYRGMCEFMNQQISEAKQHFEATRQIAQSLQNERMYRYAENWLGDIAVQEGNFEQAEQLFEEGLRMGKNNRDLTQMAFSNRSLAKLYGAMKNLKLAQKHGAAAIKQFAELEMTDKAEDTQAWLVGLAAELGGKRRD